MECAQEALLGLTRGAAAAARERTVKGSCDLLVTIPKWHPSPDSSLKRRLASEVLQELMNFGWERPKEVYVGDFNVHDPEMDFYIVDADGKENIQGCRFNAFRVTHCEWHMYGQSTLESVKREIMERPYRLVPPRVR